MHQELVINQTLDMNLFNSLALNKERLTKLQHYQEVWPFEILCLFFLPENGVVPSYRPSDTLKDLSIILQIFSSYSG